MEHDSEFCSGFVWRVCLVSAMGGLLFGYDWVVIGGARVLYEPFFEMTSRDYLKGFTATSALLGCLLGAWCSGALTDRFGRKRLLLLSGLLFSVSAVWTAFANDLMSFNFARVLGGIGIGLASNLSPMYIAEIAPASRRGQLVSINQLTIVIGVLAAQIVNLLISRGVPADATTGVLRTSWYGQTAWRWMFAAELVPALTFFLLMFFVPESPRWLAKVGRWDAARRVLGRVGKGDYADREIEDIRSTLATADAADSVRYRDLFRADLMPLILLGIFLAVFQQWCGINVIFYYAPEIFKAAGQNVDETFMSIVCTGGVNLAATLIALPLVDRLGRRPLMLFGAGSLAIIYAVLGSLYYAGSQGPHMVALVLAAIACYAVSLAPVTWVLISEIFPNRVRGAAMSISVLALWAACSVLTFSFPALNRQFGTFAMFGLFSVICFVGFAFMLLHLRETRGLSLEKSSEACNRALLAKFQQERSLVTSSELGI